MPEMRWIEMRRTFKVRRIYVNGSLHYGSTHRQVELAEGGPPALIVPFDAQCTPPRAPSGNLNPGLAEAGWGERIPDSGGRG